MRVETKRARMTKPETEAPAEVETKRGARKAKKETRQAEGSSRQAAAQPAVARGLNPCHRYPPQHCHRGEGVPRRPLLELARRAAFSQCLLLLTGSRGKPAASSQLQLQSAHGVGRKGVNECLSLQRRGRAGWRRSPSRGRRSARGKREKTATLAEKPAWPAALRLKATLRLKAAPRRSRGERRRRSREPERPAGAPTKGIRPQRRKKLEPGEPKSRRPRGRSKWRVAPEERPTLP